MKQEKIYQIKDMKFPSQIKKILDKHHIWSSYTLCQMTYQQIESLDGILPEYMDAIEKTLSQFGFTLADRSLSGTPDKVNHDSVAESTDNNSFDEWFYESSSLDDLLDWDDLDEIANEEQKELEEEELKDDVNAKSLCLTRSSHVSKFPYPENLLYDLFEGKFIKNKNVLWDDVGSGFACAISSLKPQRIGDMILLRYKYCFTLATIAQYYDCSSSYVSTIIQKGLRCLRHPARYRIYKNGLNDYLQSQKVIEKEKVEHKAYMQGYCQASAEINDGVVPKSFMTIEEAGFRIRTCTCLRQTKINNIFELMLYYAKHKDGFSSVRHFSKSDVREVEEKLCSIIPNWKNICFRLASSALD